MSWRPLLLAWLTILGGGPALGRDTAAAPGQEEVLARSEAAIGREVAGELRFTATDGRTISMADLRGQPLVISLVYTSCYHTCPLITRHLADVVSKARAALGEASFTVATIGFDTPNDTPIRMRQFATEQGIRDRRWLFLSTDEPTMQRLSDAVGFSYRASTKGFDHLAQTTVLDREGRVYRQVYGERYSPPALIEPLKELVFDTPPGAGLIATLADDVKLFCTVFDPATGKYRFDYSLFIDLFVGLSCLGALAVFAVRSWRRAV